MNAIVQATDIEDAVAVPQDTLLPILARLLDAAGYALERDQSTALACLTRAAALINAASERDERQASRKGALAPWQVRRLTGFIDANLDRAIAATELSALVRLSSGHFFRCFKRSFGESPFAFVARRRVLRAQELMLTTDEPLAQVALAVGLCDQSHFTRVFRRVVGESPSAWRRRVTALDT